MFGLKLIKTQMMIFFSAKNLLTILVYAYRQGMSLAISATMLGYLLSESSRAFLIKIKILVDKMRNRSKLFNSDDFSNNDSPNFRSITRHKTECFSKCQDKFGSKGKTNWSGWKAGEENEAFTWKSIQKRVRQKRTNTKTDCFQLW